MTQDPRRTSPPFPRNRDPILAVLRQRGVDGEPHRLLELASGPGQHACYFAQQLPWLSVQPTDKEPGLLASIDGWRDSASNSRIAPARLLDVTDPPNTGGWPQFDSVLAVNFFHMVSLDVVEDAFALAGSVLRSGGHIIVYDCFVYHGRHVSNSNQSFHTRLRMMGGAVHRLEDVNERAAGYGFGEPTIYWLPANNQCVLWALEH